MPSITNGFQVLAFSHEPPAVSRTGAYVASVWRVVLRPSTINQPVTRGQTITVHAEIVNRLDQPVRAANVPVYLGQVIYAQGGTQISQAFINTGIWRPDARLSADQRAGHRHIHDQVTAGAQ